MDGAKLKRPSPVRRVHLVFKTHLDLGFTDFARNVTETYFEQYIPQAVRVAQELRRAGGAERFVWTTGSWLIYEYLERAAHASRATHDRRAALEKAILEGDIAWHGLPFTTHSELMDADLFRFGLSLSQELDARFGKQTIAAKMTDVPGHTRGKEIARARPRTVILTLGERGALVVNHNTTWHAPAIQVDAVDSTGAGDAFIGALAVFLGEGLGLEQAVPRANAAAALSVTNIGTQVSFPNRAEADAFGQQPGVG